MMSKPMNEIRTRIQGKIIKLVKPNPTTNEGGGWGFISSKEKPFTKIFFHWTALNTHTIPFPELEVGDRVEFDLVDYVRFENGVKQSMGWRALRIEVLEETEEVEE